MNDISMGWHFLSAKYALWREGNARDTGSAAGAVMQRGTINGDSHGAAVWSRLSLLIIGWLFADPKQ